VSDGVLRYKVGRQPYNLNLQFGADEEINRRIRLARELGFNECREMAMESVRVYPHMQDRIRTLAQRGVNEEGKNG